VGCLRRKSLEGGGRLRQHEKYRQRRANYNQKISVKRRIVGGFGGGDTEKGGKTQANGRNLRGGGWLGLKKTLGRRRKKFARPLVVQGERGKRRLYEGRKKRRGNYRVLMISGLIYRGKGRGKMKGGGGEEKSLAKYISTGNSGSEGAVGAGQILRAIKRGKTVGEGL